MNHLVLGEPRFPPPLYPAMHDRPKICILLFLFAFLQGLSGQLDQVYVDIVAEREPMIDKEPGITTLAREDPVTHLFCPCPPKGFSPPIQ